MNEASIPARFLEDAKAHCVGDFFREDDFVFPEDSPLLYEAEQPQTTDRLGPAQVSVEMERRKGSSGWNRLLVARMERQENLTPWLKSCPIQTQYQ